MVNAAAFVAGVPIAILVIPVFGMTGAAGVWLGINVGIMLVAMPLMHRGLLIGELGAFYFRDILPPVLVATITAAVAYSVGPRLQRDAVSIMWLGLTGFCALAFSTLAASRVRPWLKQKMRLGSAV